MWEVCEVVELLWKGCWCLYMLCAYMLLGEFPYMLLVLDCWCKHVLKYVGVDCWGYVNICIVVGYVICPCIIICRWWILLYSIIRGDYSGWLWCSVGIRGDGLRGDLVPHAYRSCLGALHKNNMINNCLCARCELRVGAFVCLVISCNWWILYLCNIVDDNAHLWTTNY